MDTKYKLIAVDLDGTLCNSQHIIPSETINLFIELQERGIKIAIVSGRPECGVRYASDALALKKYGGFILPFNGAYIKNCQTDGIFANHILPNGYAKSVASRAREDHCDMVVYDGIFLITNNIHSLMARAEADLNGMYLMATNDFSEFHSKMLYKFMIMGESKVINMLELPLQKQYGNWLDIYRSEPGYLDVVAPGVNKGNGIKKLAQHLGIDREEIIAFGDNYNDLLMIQYAGKGVAMGNAEAEVKEIADAYTTTCDQQGVAEYLKKMLM